MTTDDNETAASEVIPSPATMEGHLNGEVVRWSAAT
jgi:hypothetical protein